HFRPAVDQPRDDPPLAVAEAGLAEALEDLGDAVAGSGFDLGIRIDEIHAEAPREPPAHGGFPHAHQSYEHDGTVDHGQAVHHGGGGYTACSLVGQKARVARYMG